MKRAELTRTGWLEKENEVRKDCALGSCPEALYQMTRQSTKRNSMEQQ